MTRNTRIKRGLVWLVCAGLLAGIGWTGTSCLRQHSDEPRQPTSAEVNRLAAVPVRNAESDPVALSLRFPDAAGGAGLTGQIDWSRPMITAVTAPKGESRPDGLIQAVPGLVASHTADDDADIAKLPGTGWTVHRAQAPAEDDTDPARTAADIAMSALLAMRGTDAANANQLRDKTTWLKSASIDGAAVDVFRAPLLLGTDAAQASGTNASGGAEAVFWVDRDGALRRVQFDPAGSGLVTADFLLAKQDVPDPEPVPVLGGAANDPRDLTEAEVDALSQLRQRNSGSGAEVHIELPVGDDEMIRAGGWVDWRVPMVYMAINAPGKKHDGLLFAMAGGAATKTMTVDEMPPDTPATDGWETEKWSDRVTKNKASDLDTLLFKLMVMTSTVPDDPEAVSKNAAWLREDAIGDTGTQVVEFPIAGDPKSEEPGTAPFRYWLDSDEQLRRIELRTDGLGLGHADLTPQEPPQLQLPPDVVQALIAG